MEAAGIISRSLVGSRGTQTCLDSSVTNTGNEKEVCFCMDLMAIFCEFNRDMLARKDALGSRRSDSFWDGMRMMLRKVNQNIEAIFIPLFSI